MKNFFVATVCILIFVTGCQEKNTQPNIIYILADDLGYGDVSVYNPDGKIKTPNIDQLAEEGMRFTDAHTSSSVCTPTRYGILTGRYNWRTRLKSGVLTGKSKALIDPDRTTVPSLLKKSGYKTAFIGKWHLGWNWQLKGEDTTGVGWQSSDFDVIDFSKPISQSPNDIGFDYAYGHAASLDMAPYVYVENGRVTAQPTRLTVDTGKYSWWREGPTAEDFIHDQVTPNFFERSIQYINENASSDQPFFLYLALPAPHTPILPLEEWRGKSGLNPYADFTMMIDDYVGQLLTALEQSGEAKNTIVIFTSDNGCSPAAGFEEMVQQGHQPSYRYRGHKADIFEGGHRVPFIVRWPGKVKAGTTSDAVISSTDLMATVADLTEQKLDANEGEDSFSLLPILSGNPAEYKRDAVVHHSIYGNFGIRRGPWKLILTPGSGGWSYPSPDRDQAILDTLPTRQLYNLVNDLGEQNNLLAQNWNVVGQLQSLLNSYIESGRSTPGIPQANDPIDFEWTQINFTKD